MVKASVDTFYGSADFDKKNFDLDKNWDFAKRERFEIDTYENLKGRPHRSHKSNGVSWYEFCDQTKTMTHYYKIVAMGEILWVKQVFNFEHPDEVIRMYLAYRCENCLIEWGQVHGCYCNDRCPECNREIKPIESYELKESCRK